jgi:hypothetical protein
MSYSSDPSFILDQSTAFVVSGLFGLSNPFFDTLHLSETLSLSLSEKWIVVEGGNRMEIGETETETLGIGVGLGLFAMLAGAFVILVLTWRRNRQNQNQNMAYDIEAEFREEEREANAESDIQSDDSELAPDDDTTAWDAVHEELNGSLFSIDEDEATIRFWK